MEEVRIGIIGAGRIAQVMSAAYSQIRECRLLAVTDIIRSAAERLAARFNIPIIHADYRELLASREVDAVLICVPTQWHEEVTLAAAEAGKHIFCQKPMALTARQVGEMIAAAQEHRAFLMEAMWTRFVPLMQAVMGLVGSGRIGESP